MFDGLKDSVRTFSEKAKGAVAETELDEDTVDDLLWDLEQALLRHNVAVDVVDAITADVKDDLVGTAVTRTKGGAAVEEALRDAIRDVLTVPAVDIPPADADTPALVLVMGFNGAGKTTTIAKLAHMLRDSHDIVLAAGDTFRAASIEQLQEHADALDLPCVAHEYESDPAAVVYDAVEHAEKTGADLVLADTAGRSHADRNLMDELAKIADVNDPDLKLLVVDALAGNDVLSQAEEYGRIGFDGLVLTKADIDDHGGAALSLGYVTGKPVLYLGTGQDYQDLEEFDPDALVDRLLGA